MGELLHLIKEDVMGMVVDRKRGRLAYAGSVLLKLMLYPRIQAVVLFRISHAFYRWRLTPIAYYLQAAILSHSGAEIHPAAKIGPGFCLVHSSGIVIGPYVDVGAHFICYHGVTLGSTGKGEAMPTLGEWVTASAGAKILGGVHIGDRAIVGANAVVLKDVPACGVAVGIPARVVRVQSETEGTSLEP